MCRIQLRELAGRALRAAVAVGGIEEVNVFL
jgi:hypothetical protein